MILRTRCAAFAALARPTCAAGVDRVCYSCRLLRPGTRRAGPASVWRAARRSGALTAAALGAPGDPIHFSELPLDRAAHLRTQAAELEQLLAAPTTLLLPLHRGRALVGPAGLLPAAEEAAGAAAVAARAAAGGPPPPQLQLQLGCSQDGQQVQPRLALAPHSFAPPAAWVTAEGASPGLVPLVVAVGQGAGVALAPAIDSSMGFVFLGVTPQGAHAVFACELSGDPSVTVAGAAQAGDAPSHGGSGSSGGVGAEQAARCQWEDVRKAGQAMAGADAAVLALATGLARWHASAAFCSRTGRPMAAVYGGHGRAPTSRSEGGGSSSSSSSGGGGGGGRVRAVYPRVDPAVIVAATCGDWLLLGRKRAWDKGRYSLLAGFCELGETLEQACVREVAEESGVPLDPSSLAYASSQPWPFPQSLMVGFVGEAAGGPRGPPPGPPSALLSEAGRLAAHDVGLREEELAQCLLPAPPPVKVDPEELEDARWFHRSYLTAALGAGAGASPSELRHAEPRYYPRPSAEGFRIPGRYALANRIISGWLRERQEQWRRRQQQQQGRQQGGASSGPRGGPGALGWLGSLLPDVSIDEGTFKYVLLRVTEEGPGIGSRGGEAEGSLPSPAAGGPSYSGSSRSGGGGGEGGGGGGDCSGGAQRSSPASTRSKLIVRGDSRAAYHDHILRAARAEAGRAAEAQGPPGASEGRRLRVEVLGGGRMEHYPDQRLLIVYGYSSAFGQAPHEVTAALLRRWLPFHDITVSYDGY